MTFFAKILVHWLSAIWLLTCFWQSWPPKLLNWSTSASHRSKFWTWKFFFLPEPKPICPEERLNQILGRSLIEWALLPRNIKKTLNSLCPCLKVSAAVREDTPRLQMGLIKCKKETTTFWALGRSTFPKKMKGLPKILQNSSVSNFGPFWAQFGP